MSGKRVSLGKIALAVGLCMLVGGCGRRAATVKTGGPPARPGTATGPIALPTTEPRAGTAVVVLLDTSGSMAQAVRDKDGKSRPKDQIARDALEGIIRYTEDWKKKNPDRELQLGIYTFSSSSGVLLPIGPFDAAKAKAALARVPRSNSGTAIGRALEDGFKALYQAGLVRKYIVCITDGENTSGPSPEQIGRQMFAQTKGAVEMHFVAFDTSARRFAFLNEVNGHVVEASDGGKLQAELGKIYEKRILAEAEEPADK